VVLMFWEKRNELCNVMKETFWNMAMAKKKDAVFCRVDVDKCKDITELYRVEALPTFLLIKDRNEKGRVVGAKMEELNTTIKAKIYTNIPI
jgi:thioredoxin 1